MWGSKDKLWKHFSTLQISTQDFIIPTFDLSPNPSVHKMAEVFGLGLP